MPKQVRSPNYPYIDLQDAIDRARQFHQHERRNAAPVSVAAKHWGYTGASSAASQTVAALVAFGLMQGSGSGETRTVRLTQLALRILLDSRENAPERVEALKEAALSPAIHKQVMDRYPSGLPSNENLKHELLFNWEPSFNENAVDGFIRELRSTLSLAGLTSVVPVSRNDAGTESVGDMSEPPTGQAMAEGQPESRDVGSFPEPRQTREAFDTKNTASSRRDVFSLPEGEATIQWPSPLSTDSVKDLGDWLDLIKRKIRRSVSAAE